MHSLTLLKLKIVFSIILFRSLVEMFVMSERVFNIYLPFWRVGTLFIRSGNMIKWMMGRVTFIQKGTDGFV